MNSYGVGSPVDAKAMQYKDNPQGIMDEYVRDPNLLTLIAMERVKQRIAMEQSAVAQQFNNDPETIYAKTERELYNSASQDAPRSMGSVVDQTAGSLAQQARVAQQQAQQPQGNPMEQGIASQAAPNMTGMAAGGIVKFAEGGTVQEQQQAAVKAAREKDPAKYADMTYAQVLRALATEGRDVTEASAWAQKLGAPQGTGIAAALPPEAVAPVAISQDNSRATPNLLQPIQDLAPAPEGSTVPPVAGGRASSSSSQTSNVGGITASGITMPALGQRPPEEEALRLAQIERYKKAVAADPEEVARNSRDESAQFQGRDAKKAEYAKRIADMEAGAPDPEAERRRQLYSFLANTANTGNLGEWGAGGIRGALTEQKSQQDALTARNKALFEASNTASASDTAIATGAQEIGSAAGNRTSNRGVTAEQGIGTLLNQDTTSRLAQQKGTLDVAIANQATKLGVDTANLKAKTDAAKIAVDSARNQLIAKDTSMNALLDSRDKNAKIIQDIRALYQDSMAMQMAKQAAMKAGKGSPEAEQYMQLVELADKEAAKAATESQKVYDQLDARIGVLLNGPVDATGYEATRISP